MHLPVIATKSFKVTERVSKGEIHFIIAEPLEDFDEAKLRKITRKEAIKPLLLLRVE